MRFSTSHVKARSLDLSAQMADPAKQVDIINKFFLRERMADSIGYSCLPPPPPRQSIMQCCTWAPFFRALCTELAPRPHLSKSDVRSPLFQYFFRTFGRIGLPGIVQSVRLLGALQWGRQPLLGVGVSAFTLRCGISITSGRTALYKRIRARWGMVQVIEVGQRGVPTSEVSRGHLV